MSGWIRVVEGGARAKQERNKYLVPVPAYSASKAYSYLAFTLEL